MRAQTSTTLLLFSLLLVGCRDQPTQPSQLIAPPAEARAVASAVLIAAGDIGCATTQGGQATATLIQSLTGTVATLGDNAYPDGTSSDYRRCYAPGWGHALARTRPSPGNHDYHVSGASGYFNYFGARAGPSRRGYYSYDVGSWHIVSLDSEINAGVSSPQAAWLRNDLASHPSKCTLAYWHKPLFTSGRTHPPEVAMRPLFTVLYNAGADIVLSGHNHQYERFAPQSPNGQAAPSRGIRQFVVGTGGVSLYPFASARANSQVRYNGGYGVLKLSLNSGSYSWRFISVAGKTFTDAGTASCHS